MCQLGGPEGLLPGLATVRLKNCSGPTAQVPLWAPVP